MKAVARPALLSFLFGSCLLAQRQGSVEDAVAAGSCLACGGTMLMLPVLVLVLDIVMLIWVARDSKARGMDNSIVWMLLVLFTSVLGLIVYIFSRPKGNLIPCGHCGNKRMDTSAKCPHCGNA